MPRRKEDRHSVQVLFTTEEYENLKRYAALKNISMSSLVREYTMQGIRGILTQENIDFLTPIIRSQLKSVVDVQADRIAGLVAKTCIQAGAAAYLSAEALNSFVPEKERMSDSDFSVEMLGAELGLSRSHLYKKLMCITGKGPAEFIRIIRLKRSKQLLKESQKQIAEIAYEVGFSSPKRFTVNFKNEFGISPSDYIRSLK